MNGLTTIDAESNPYVKTMSSVGTHGNSGMWPSHVRRFDSRGRYERTLFQYPPSTAPNRANGFQLLDAKASRPPGAVATYPVCGRGESFVDAHHAVVQTIAHIDIPNGITFSVSIRGF